MRQRLFFMTLVALIGIFLVSGCSNPTSSRIDRDANELLDEGVRALEAGNIDAAIRAFEAAWRADPTNQEVKVYAALGRLASIVVDPAVRSLMQNHLGIQNYPTTFSGLMDPRSWMQNHYEERFLWGYWDPVHGSVWCIYGPDGEGYYRWGEHGMVFISSERRYETSSILLPQLARPSWIAESQFYQESLTREGLRSGATFGLLLFANLIDRNTNGLNNLLDGIINVFEQGLNAAVQRTDGLTERVRLTQATLEAFGVGDIFEGGDIDIGQAELRILFSGLRFITAGLQWVAAYDWNTPLNFLANQNVWQDNPEFTRPANLPLRNNFLGYRNNGMMRRSRESFVTAIEDAIMAYDLILNDAAAFPQAVRDVLEEFEWARTSFVELKNAINSGSEFHFREGGDTLLRIDMGRLFNPGQLALDAIIYTRASGNNRRPAFFTFADWGEIPIGEISSATGFGESSANLFGFRLKMERFSEIVIYPEIGRETEYLPILNRHFAEILWSWYSTPN